MTNETLVILGGKRTVFGAYGGALKDLNPTDLGLAASEAALKQAGVQPDQIDHVIFGNVLHSARDSIYTPRHIGLKLGIPQRIPALGINRLCGSGFQAMIEAYHQMLAGDTQIALVGGVENMSLSPYVLRGARWGLRLGNTEAADLMTESLVDTYAGIPMAVTAENLAQKYEISRTEIDAFALRSQTLAEAAKKAGRFDAEWVAVKTLTCDEHPRPQTTLETLAKLKPVFKKDGVVTAGNASGIVDGAAALVVSTLSHAQKLGLKPLGKMVGYSIVGCDPKMMGIGPAPAIQNLLAKTGWSLESVDLLEINEAFSPQVLSVLKELKIPDSYWNDKLNVNGGAIAIGHPLAASGTRIVMHLLYELKRRGKKRAIGSACIGGGQGIAVALEVE